MVFLLFCCMLHAFFSDCFENFLLIVGVQPIKSDVIGIFFFVYVLLMDH